MASTQSRSGGQTSIQPASAPTQTTNIPFRPQPEQAILRLRGASTHTGELEDGGEGDTKRRPRIQWAEDVIDNEGLGRKKSKVCCIYHAPKGIDESSDESSSDSDDSDSGADDGGARPARGSGKKDCGEGHNHGHEGHSHGVGKGKGRKRSPNAYEKLPKPKAANTNEKN